MIPVPYALLLGGLVAGGYYAKVQHDKKVPPKGELTPERQVIFETALNEVKDPAKLRALAKAFREQGLTREADILEKRASLRDLPPDVKEARRDAYRKGMDSKDPLAVDNLANAFEKEGATGAAEALRKQAEALRAQYGTSPEGKAAAQATSDATDSPELAAILNSLPST